MAFGVILAIAQKVFSDVGNKVKDYKIEKERIESEKYIAIASEEEKTKQLEIQKEIAEKGLEKSVNSLQEQQEKTKQTQIEASQSTYNTFVENVSKQTQYNVEKLTDATNDYLARFRPDHTRKVFDTLIFLARCGFWYYGLVLAAYLVMLKIGVNMSAEISFENLLIFPMPKNIFSSIVLFPAWVFYLIYEQWTYMQTYWYISRDEEKQRSIKKKS